MLLSTGIVALSRKVKDERDRKKEARQGVLSVGPSDVAKRAFEGQTHRMLEAGSGSTGQLQRAGTQIKYEDPNDIGAESPGDADINMDPEKEKPGVSEAQRAVDLGLSSPTVQSEIASSPGVMSPTDQTLTMSSTARTSWDEKSRPPTYMSRAESSATSARSHSRYSRDETVGTPMQETQSLSTRSTNSVGTHAVRVKTRGAQLSSGFDYHPALYDLKVHPDKWATFTEQVVHATKVSASENGKAWAAATATAMSGAIVTSVFLKKYMDRSNQEKKVRTGISDMSDGGLGSMLQKWNDQYFAPQGLFVHLELSESAMKNEEQRTKAFRKPALLYSKREERERKEQERKYVIVVTKLDADGAPTEAIKAMERNEEVAGNPAAAVVGTQGSVAPPENIAEMPGDTHQGFLIPELPGDDGLGAAELPGGISLGFSSEKSMQPPPGYAELEPDKLTTQAVEQTIPKEMEDTSGVVDEKEDVKPRDVGSGEKEGELKAKDATGALDKEMT